jgi:ABC-type branched-subunit amino acid transport system substrate-binding protein
VGAYSSGIGVPAGQVFNEKKVVWVTDATSNQLKTIGPYVFDTAGLADQEAALVDFAKADNPGKKDLKVAGLFPNNPIGQDNDSVSRQRVKELGLIWAHSMLYQVGSTDYRAELQALIDSKPDAILTNVYDSDAQVQQRQLFEMGFTDLSKFYSYNPGAYSTLDAKFKDGIKGLDYVTSGPRAEAFAKKYVAKYGKIYTDAWAPPFYDAVWIVANAINLAHSLDSAKIRDAMWPAAYHYLGISGQGDKGLNMYGKQAADQTSGRIFKDGKLVPYQPPGGSAEVIVFRYAGPEGVPLDTAPTAEDFKKLYPGQ